MPGPEHDALGSSRVAGKPEAPAAPAPAKPSIEPATPPRLGCVKYLNARPLVRGWPGEVIFDHPAVLCQLLADGHLDVALVSSFEYLRNPIYKIVDDVAIASEGPVYSVVMAHARGTWPREIEVDPASATGIALLQILMAERAEKFSVVEMPADKLSLLSEQRSRFLIGDQAIAFRQKFGQVYEYWDLGEEWFNLTQLPFVYALWLIRPEVGNAASIAQQLRAMRDENLAKMDRLIAEEKNFDRNFSRGYYKDFLRFHFAEREKKGLGLFHRLCAKFGLLPQGDIEFALL